MPYIQLIQKIDLAIWKTDQNTKKINHITLEIFQMIIAVFLINNLVEKVCFFEKTFWLANISVNVILQMSFFTLSNINIQFIYQKFYWRLYIVIKALSTIHYIIFINHKKFAAIVLEKNEKTFEVYISSLRNFNKGFQIFIYPTYKTN